MDMSEELNHNPKLTPEEALDNWKKKRANFMSRFVFSMRNRFKCRIETPKEDTDCD